MILKMAMGDFLKGDYSYSVLGKMFWRLLKG